MKSYIQRFSLVVSLFGTHFLEDPNDLFVKIGQKLRVLGILVPPLRLPTPSQHGEDLYEQGQLTLSADAFEQSGFRGKARARKIRRQLAELDFPISKSKPLESSRDPKNVLFYLTNSKPFTQSGYTDRSHFLLKALQKHGLNVCAVTRLGYPVVIGEFPIKSRLTVDGIEYRQMLPTMFPRTKAQQIELAVTMLVEEAREFDADILHTTTDYKNAIIVSRAAHELRIPWIYETRGELQKTWLSKRKPESQIIAKESEYYIAAETKELEAMQNASALIQLSDVSKRNAVSQGIEEDKIRIVPNAVSSSAIGREFNEDDIRQELGLSENKVIVGSITSVVQYEGLDDLIRAIELLPDVHCIIVGEGEDKLRLEALVDELSLGKRVQFVGKQPAKTIWKWYAALDVFVIPRKDQEVCRTVTPIKTLMAQANGVPVVASDLPALREVTGNYAVYFPAEIPEGIANAIREVLNMDPTIIRQQAEKARDWVRSRTWDSNARNLIEVYRSGIDLS
ncbi:glycosyl transferase family 1 [Corynebacterium stationis]|uniref:glycosyltransferase family 4 protein n=1 Tax=Corynebacterium stationis TaxID=1705 RepID=UPI0009506563|nr:glycosyltransferase family 4 protein [Corynebacterium stationis]APT94556.1 glycosyl transferase family 1 [Corynebacterium stationis]